MAASSLYESCFSCHVLTLQETPSHQYTGNPPRYDGNRNLYTQKRMGSAVASREFDSVGSRSNSSSTLDEEDYWTRSRYDSSSSKSSVSSGSSMASESSYHTAPSRPSGLKNNSSPSTGSTSSYYTAPSRPSGSQTNDRLYYPESDREDDELTLGQRAGSTSGYSSDGKCYSDGYDHGFSSHQ